MCVRYFFFCTTFNIVCIAFCFKWQHRRRHAAMKIAQRTVEHTYYYYSFWQPLRPLQKFQAQPNGHHVCMHFFFLLILLLSSSLLLLSNRILNEHWENRNFHDEPRKKKLRKIFAEMNFIFLRSFASNKATTAEYRKCIFFYTFWSCFFYVQLENSKLYTKRWIETTTTYEEIER